jgi:tetratricopeptide (TPR) repeat protein
MAVVFRCALVALLCLVAMPPASADEPIYQVGACRDDGNSQETIAACTAVLDQGAALAPRERAAALRIRGHARLASDDARGGVADLDAALALDPADPIALLFRAAARAAAGDLAGAEQDASRSLSLRPDDPDTLLVRAGILRRERALDRAYADASRAIEREGGANARLTRAEICLDGATLQAAAARPPCDLAAALADVARARQESEGSYGDAEADALEGRVEEAQGRYDAAYAAYENGLDADPGCKPCSEGEARIKARPRGGSQAGGPETDALLARIDAEIGRAIYYSGRKLLVTTGLGRAEDGRLEIAGHLCPGLTPASPRAEIEACRARNPGGADARVRFAAADIDPGSIHMESSERTYRVLFLCKAKKPCVARPDGGAWFPGGWLTCPDPATCNRLVLDLASLLDRLAAGGP